MRAVSLLFCLFPMMAMAQTGTVVISDVTVKVGNGQTLEHTNVVVVDGKIVSVGSGTAGAGDAAIKISGTGKVLYPGFIDAYSTRLMKSAPDPKLEGRPDASTFAPPFMWVGNRRGTYSDHSAVSLLEFEKDTSSYENGIATALLVPSKGSVRGAGALVNLLPSSAKDRVLKSDVGFGLSFRGGGGEGYPSNILGVIALLRQTLADAKSVSEGVDIGAPKEGLKALNELAPLVKGQRPGIFEANFDREIERTVRISSEFGFQTMVAGGRDAYKVTSLLSQRKMPVLLAVDFSDEPSVAADKDTVAPADRQPVEYKQERLARWKEQIVGVQALLKAGITVAFSSGSSPGDYLKNIRVLIKNGLSADDALAAMTTTPAKLFGVESQLGTLEVGKQANMVLMSGPMEGEESKVEGLWIAGTAIVSPVKGGAK